MQLPSAKSALLSIFALDGVEDGGGELHGVTVPVVWVFGDPDELVGLPLGEDEVAVADMISRPRPG